MTLEKGVLVSAPRVLEQNSGVFMVMFFGI
jgi:hypothetical protein